MKAMPAATRIPALPVLLAGFAFLASASVAFAAGEGLSLCSKCVNPTIFSKTGIGSANAVAEGRITKAAVQEWCDNWQPGDKACVKQQLTGEDLKKLYRATANCSAGSITPIDGKAYTFAGAWDKSDIGAGRSRWRDAAGKIVGRDNASGGLAISQQWETLCPGGLPRSANAVARAPLTSAADAKAGQRATATLPVAGPATGEFTVGQAVLARYGGEWVRGRINAIRYLTSSNGTSLAYDVSLDNGKRGVVPQRMLRKAP